MANLLHRFCLLSLLLCLGIPIAVHSAERLILIDDFMLGYASLKGERIEIRGWGRHEGGKLVLKNAPMDIKAVNIDYTNVSQNQRMQLLKSCGNFSSCKISVIGKVSDDISKPGILAEQIVF